MISYEEYMQIQFLPKQGYKKKELARHLGISKNTVKKYFNGNEPSCHKERSRTPSKLDPYKEYILKRLEEGLPHRIPATVIYREILNMGYKGKERILRSFIHDYWLEKRTVKPPARFETQPGEQMQVDWSTVRLKNKKVSVFVAILGFSRKSYLEFTENQAEETLLRCHEKAFHFFGGVPLNVLYDNMKTVVTNRDNFGKGNHKFQKTLYDFAKHYGFTPRLCRPFRPQTKGKVERFIRYFKHSFYYPLISKGEFDESLQGLNFELHKWLSDIAENRFIRELRASPKDLYEQEIVNLQALPKTPYDIFFPTNDCHTNKTTIWTPNLKIYEEIGGKV